MTVLVLGTSSTAVALVEVLRGHHLPVVLCGGYPGDPGHALGLHSISVDYSDHAALIETLSDEAFDAVVPACNDSAYAASFALGQSRGLAWPDTAKIVDVMTNKAKLAEHLSGLGIPIPRVFHPSEAAEFVTADTPIIVKPVDADRGLGVEVVRDATQLEISVGASLAASKAGEVVLQEYIDGSLHSASVFFQDGETAAAFFVDEFCTTSRFQVNSSFFPSQLPEEIQSSVLSALNAVAASLEIRAGLLHAQFMVKDDSFHLIELMRRCPGDFFGQMIELGSGYLYTENYVRAFLDYPVDKLPQEFNVSTIFRYTLTSNFQSNPTHVQLLYPSSSVSFYPHLPSGSVMPEAPIGKFATVLIEVNDARELPNIARDPSRCIQLGRVAPNE